MLSRTSALSEQLFIIAVTIEVKYLTIFFSTPKIKIFKFFLKSLKLFSFHQFIKYTC